LIWTMTPSRCLTQGEPDPAEPEPQLPESIPDSASTDPEYTQLLLRLRGGAGGDEGEDSDEEEETALTVWEQTKARFELEPDPPPYDELMLDASPPRALPPPPDPQAGDSFPSISATTSQLSQYQLQALQQQLHQQQIQQHQQQFQQEPRAACLPRLSRPRGLLLRRGPPAEAEVPSSQAQTR
jgi:hypothetical protein